MAQQLCFMWASSVRLGLAPRLECDCHTHVLAKTTFVALPLRCRSRELEFGSNVKVSSTSERRNLHHLVTLVILGPTMATRNAGTTQMNMNRQSVATSGSVVKSRQLTHLHSQLAQLSANLSDTENLLRMTSVQAEAMRGLGSWHGGLFMAASKVLGEESVREAGR
ncbi:hypothetical protein ACCO45_010653 [Purpureocillium lilacinum]|uniref:Uncharacterized protein n=1 Tax=Purpureocillium lilacinum TaxID=33203 RepID=A0ACC4DFH5_PURLI